MVGTMTAIAIGLAAAGTATAVVGQVKAGNAANKAGLAEQERLEFNATVAEQQAKDAEQRGAYDAGRFRAQVKALVGAQRVGFAGGNVDVNSGSAADVQRDARRLGAVDERQIRLNAAREAWGFQQQATDYRMGGKTAAAAGKAQQSASRWGAAGSVLNTGSSLMLARYGWGNGNSYARSGVNGVQNQVFG
jgi:hypothetical protein